jgi:hypothetical protein
MFPPSVRGENKTPILLAAIPLPDWKVPPPQNSKNQRKDKGGVVDTGSIDGYMHGHTAPAGACPARGLSPCKKKRSRCWESGMDYKTENRYDLVLKIKRFLVKTKLIYCSKTCFHRFTKQFSSGFEFHGLRSFSTLALDFCVLESSHQSEVEASQVQ